MSDSPRLGYQPSLNGLRAVAVLLVMLEHCVAFLIPQWTQTVLPGGFIGVDVFFVLSGFLITTLLLEESSDTERISIRHFYARRALRLFPALAVMMAAALAIGYFANHETVRSLARSAVYIGLYISNWATASANDVIVGLGHTWSLAVEEQFYLVWPAVVVLALRQRWSLTTWNVVLGVGIAASIAVKAMLWMHTHDWMQVYPRTDSRADALLIGALLAVNRSRGRDLAPLRRFLVPALSVLTFAALTATTSRAWLNYGGYTLIAAAAAIVGASVLNGSTARRSWLARPLASGAAVHVGRISYALYLWHVPIFLFIAFHVHVVAALQVAIGWFATFVAAELSMRFVERPFLDLKRRLADRRAAGLEQLQPSS